MEKMLELKIAATATAVNRMYQAKDVKVLQLLGVHEATASTTTATTAAPARQSAPVAKRVRVVTLGNADNRHMHTLALPKVESFIRDCSTAKTADLVAHIKELFPNWGEESSSPIVYENVVSRCTRTLMGMKRIVRTTPGVFEWRSGSMTPRRRRTNTTVDRVALSALAGCDKNGMIELDIRNVVKNAGYNASSAQPSLSRLSAAGLVYKQGALWFITQKGEEAYMAPKINGHEHGV